MTQAPSDATHDLLWKMLLGKLAEEERQELEGRLLHDEELYGDLLDAETELLDAWARGELSSDDAERLEAHLSASAEGRAKLEVARSLATGDLEKSGPGFRLLRFPQETKPLSVAAILTLTLLSGWLGLQNRSLSQANQALRASLATQTAQPELRLRLATPRSEESEIPTLELPPESEAESVTLVLDLRGLPRHKRYRVVIQDDRDQVVYAVAGLSAPDSQSTDLVVQVPWRCFPAGLYELFLEGASVDSAWCSISRVSFRCKSSRP